MSALLEKYSKLLEFAHTAGINELVVNEQNNILYVNGSSSATVKDSIWAIYNEIDPDMRAADLVLNIDVIAGQEEEIYEIKAGDSLSKIASKYGAGVTWQKIFEANKDIIKDPNLIHPGMKIKIPR